jgi:hypothetical protein
VSGARRPSRHHQRAWRAARAYRTQDGASLRRQTRNRRPVPRRSRGRSNIRDDGDAAMPLHLRRRTRTSASSAF